MTCEVRNKEINSQCAELLVRPLYICNMYIVRSIMYKYIKNIYFVHTFYVYQSITH